jgi:hypothetical protein
MTNAGRAGHAGAPLDGGHDALPLNPPSALAKPTPTLAPPASPLPLLTLVPVLMPVASGPLVLLLLPVLAPVAVGPALSSALAPGALGPPPPLPLPTPGPSGGCTVADPAPLLALVPAADPTCDAPSADAVPPIAPLEPLPGCSSKLGVTRPPQAANRVKASPAIAVFIAEA